MKFKNLVNLIVVGFIATPVLAANNKLTGKVLVDGSSTVFPITEAVAEDFREYFPKVRVGVGVSGTGGGFKKYLKKETDINNASRPIQDKEIALAKKNNVQYKELTVAYDGITVVVSPKNTWVDYLTVAELNMIWKPGSKVSKWSDIRSTWPDKKIRLYGPGTDSGTFDYFTEAINGKSHVSRSDYTKSEDDNVLVQGVADDQYAMAYFGFAYFQANSNKLKAIPIATSAKDKAVLPSLVTIQDGSYKPLSRPIFIYVNPTSIKTNEGVYEFAKHYMKSAASLVKQVGYVPLEEKKYTDNLNTIEALRK